MNRNDSTPPLRALRQRPLASLGLGSLAISILLAFAATPQPVIAQETPVRISIQAQPLGEALIKLANTYALELAYAPDVVAGRQAPAVSGNLTADQALQRLLEGTGIRVRRSGRNVSLSRGSEATQLDVIRVAGRRDELPPAYAGGQVATGGRVGMLGEKDFMETPFNTVSYTERYIQDSQVRMVSDLIGRTDASVRSVGVPDGSADTFAVRGFDVSMSDVAMGGVYGVAPYYRVTPEFFERVEVLKGPSALLNGMPPDGSVGGSVNLVPKRAPDEPLTRVTGNVSSDSLWGGHVDIGRRFGPDQQFGVRFNGIYRKGDTAVEGQNQTTKMAGLGLDWRTNRARASLDLFSSDVRVNGANSLISLAPGIQVPEPLKPDEALGPDWLFGTYKDKSLLAKAEVDITDDISAHASYGYGKNDYDALSFGAPQVFNPQGDMRGNLAHQRRIYDRQSAEIGARARFRTASIGHELVATVNYYQQDLHFGFLRNILPQPWVTNLYDQSWGSSPDTSVFSNASLPKTGAMRMTSVGLADTLSFLNDRVQLTLGVRRQSVVNDSFNGATGQRTARYDADATTPAIAVLVKATETLSLYANYIEGLSQGAIAPVTAANAGELFPPYKTRQQEVGLKMDFGQFAGTLSAFQIHRPSSYTDPVTNIFSFGGEQRNRGLEFSLFGEPAKGWRMIGGFTYLQAILTKTAGGLNEGRTATNAPRWQAKAGVEWDAPMLSGLTLTGNVVMLSRQYINADNSLSLPGRAVFDAGARYRASVSGKPVTLRATVHNLTNRAYWTGTSGVLGLGAPRTFVLSATVDF